MFLRRHLSPAILVLCLLIGLPACNDSDTSAGAPDYAATRAAMIPRIESLMAESEVAGLSLALVDGQRVVWTQGFGLADREQATPVVPETLFEIGSVSKTMTTLLVLREVEAGRLDLDQPLASVLAEFAIQPPLGSYSVPDGAITIRTMLTHHSGLPGDLMNASVATRRIPDYDLGVLRYLPEQHAEFPAGFVHSYSNAAVALLAEVLGRSSGATFAELTAELFREMGMDHSTFEPEPLDLPGRARDYILDLPIDFFHHNMPAAGSVISSAADMARYLRTLLSGGRAPGGKRIISPATFEAMLTAQNADNLLDGDKRIGLIWLLNDPELDYAGRLFWHDGATIAANSHLAVLRDQGLGVFVVTNSPADTVVAAVARETLTHALEEKTGLTPPVPEIEDSPEVDWDPAVLAALSGIYVTEAGYDRLEAVDGGLAWTANAGPTADGSEVAEPVLLTPRADGTLAAETLPGAALEPATVYGRQVLFRRDSEGRLPYAERFLPPEERNQAWEGREGNWTPENLDPDDARFHLPLTVDMDIRLRYEGNLLVVIVSGKKLVLEPVSDTLCHIRGFKRGQGGALRVLTDNTGAELLDYLYVSYEKVAEKE
jgi:CubicO group peptidase (beta-lactamase class C family)